MTGPDDDGPEELSAQERDEHEEIRRLLAQARPTGPIPADVGARMDAVLAGLAAERTTADGTPSDGTPAEEAAPVISLSAHRRRRAGGLLVAAAAIVVAGVALSSHRAGDGRPAAGSPSSALDSSAQDESAGSSDTAPQAPTPTEKAPQSLAGGSSRLQLHDGRVVVHARSFPADATAAKSLLKTYAAQGSASPSTSASAGDVCTATPAGSEAVRATFQRADAVLVYHRPAGDTQVVDLYVCGQSQPVRSVTLPAP